MKLKEQDPSIGKVADYYGEDYEIIGVKQRRGRKVLIGRPFGSHLTYYLDPAKVQIFNSL